MTAYPVVFTYRELLKGRGFLAGVRARGRALIVHDDNEWWIHGVQPGVLSEGGDTFDEARLLFRQTFREILFDLAEQARSFESFESETMKLLNEVSEPMRARWNEAVQIFRAGETHVDGPLQGVETVPAQETPVQFLVELIQQSAIIVPDNRADEFALAYATA